MAKKRSEAKGGPRADPGPTGCEVGERRQVPGRNGGTLTPHPPGSNGGTKRGPDLKPRHIIRAIHLKTITDVGRLALPPDAAGNGHRKSGAARRKRAKVAHAFITNAAMANQGIALDAAEGDPVARGQLLRLLHDMHEVMQPAPDEAKSGGGPILPKFNRPKPQPPAPSEAPAEDEAAVVIDGQPYVEA
jgi:hypothetical protein